jgi:ABC-type branched-subunit amino acid transport system substrate-binding protein
MFKAGSGAVVAILASLLCAGAALADGDEVKLGQTMPYSGPASAFGIIGETYVAYFKMINDRGGINGHKINLLSVDDGYSPAKTVEATRRLVEQDKVLAIFGSMGTAPNSAIQPYLNQQKVPQIIGTGASRFATPDKYPWTISIYPSYELEGVTLAKYALSQKPDPKIAILYQNDDSGRDFVKGFKKGLGDKVGAILAESGYDVSEPTIDSQVQQLKASGADTLFLAPIPKFAAQAIREAARLEWKPLILMTSPGSSIESALTPGGLQNSIGIVSTAVVKTSTSPRWANDDDVIKFKKFVADYMPNGKPWDFNITYGYVEASIMAEILANAGAEITRETLRQAMTNMKPATAPMLLPGVEVSTHPDNYSAFNIVRLQKFDGQQWRVLDEILH